VTTTEGQFTFENLTFNKAGVYTFEIREVIGEDETVVYDESVYTVNVTVTKDFDHLDATTEILLNGETAEQIVFNNKTVAGTEVTLNGSKYMDGQLADGYQFVLMQDGEELQTVTTTEGKFTFNTLYFNNAGVYTYEIREVLGDDEMVVYDESVYTVTVTVTREGEALVAATEIVRNGETAEQIVFNNKTVTGTEVTLGGSKYLDGDLADGFDFVLVQNNEVLETVTTTNGLFTFTTLNFDEIGTYTFHIMEVIGDDETIIYDESIYTVTVTVTREGDALVAAVEIELDEVVVEEVEFYNETSTIITPPDIPEDPTPDGDMILPVMLVMLVSAALMGGCVVLKRKEA
jgi:pilin isopeptide linkage protein